MKVVVTGKGGQLAWELEKTKPGEFEAVFLSRAELDVSDTEAVHDVISELKPDVVINTAAYTAVDKAETNASAAYESNSFGARYLAEACLQIGARLIHVSTDFVFDGKKAVPYTPYDAPNPLSVYGASKLEGEREILQKLNSSALVVRTSWVYSAHGNNFVKTMLRLMAERSKLSVVYDQVGSPTWARGLAECLWCCVGKREVSGVHHWADAGIASWYDFAVAIQELALEKGLLTSQTEIRPIPSVEYPTPAARPAFSVMDKTLAEKALGLNTIHWRAQLSLMLDSLSKS